MNTKLLSEINSILGDKAVDEVYGLVDRTPVSFAALRNQRIVDTIYRMLDEGVREDKIARAVGRGVKTIRNWQKKRTYRFRKNKGDKK